VYATTFYHLGCKFARSTHPQPLSRFLTGTIASHLRYCPVCVGETEYYRLTWRFTILNGCYEHRCELLVHCGYCKAPIPMFCAPFAVNRCPKCSARLSDSRAPALSNQEYEQVNRQTQELIYLLIRQPWEVIAADVVARLGEEFMRLRMVKHQTIAEVSRQLGTTVSIIEGIERGNVRGRGASFRDYLAYAGYLNVAVSQLIRSIIIPASETDESLLCLAPPLATETIREDIGGALLQAIQQAVLQLEAAGSDVTQESIGAVIGMTPQGLKKYPMVAAFLRQHTREQATQRRRNWQASEAQLLERVHALVVQLQATGQPVSQRAIARGLNMPWSSFRSYPTVRTWLQKLEKNQQDDHEL
jgi:transcriptional regulator with XRE-family HTH domain